jgi:hypothetical protein
MGVIYSSEISFEFHRTTWCYTAEDRTLRSHRCKNLRSNKELKVLCSKPDNVGTMKCTMCMGEETLTHAELGAEMVRKRPLRRWNVMRNNVVSDVGQDSSWMAFSV